MTVKKAGIFKFVSPPTYSQINPNCPYSSLKGSFTSVANFHLDASIVGRKAEQGAIGFAAYRSAEKLLDEATGKTYDYSRRRGVLYKEIIAPQHAPAWVYDRARLWNAVESCEKRKDSQVAREIMVALPAELDASQQIKLVRRFIRQHFIKLGMIADFAIHAPSQHGDQRNYHAHILLTMREITSEGFGGKIRKWNGKFYIYQWRQGWEQHVNQALQQAGFDCRIDGRSHASKGLDREPRLHLGHQATALERNGERSERGDANRAIEARNAARAELERRSGTSQIEGKFDELEPWGDGEAQAISPPAESQHVKNTLQDADPDKTLNTVQLQDESLLALSPDPQKHQMTSFEARKATLERDKEAFEARRNELHRQLENVSDEKTQARLQLQEKLESAKFTKAYSEGLAGILADEGLQQNHAEIAILQHKARKADRDYKRWAAEWDFRAVRDDNYLPRDAKSAEKITQFKKKEKRRWAEFAVKAERNGWSPSRIEKEGQTLQKRMDRQLALELGIDLGVHLGRDR
ncbi:MAG: MobQ family relaxase [Methylomicrobium sp.]